jgi:hypothetical protein
VILFDRKPFTDRLSWLRLTRRTVKNLVSVVIRVISDIS